MSANTAFALKLHDFRTVFYSESIYSDMASTTPIFMSALATQAQQSGKLTVDASDALYGIMKDRKLIECNMDTFNALRGALEHRPGPTLLASQALAQRA